MRFWDRFLDAAAPLRADYGNALQKAHGILLDTAPEVRGRGGQLSLLWRDDTMSVEVFVSNTPEMPATVTATRLSDGRNAIWPLMNDGGYLALSRVLQQY